jgi:hypothetical protein
MRRLPSSVLLALAVGAGLGACGGSRQQGLPAGLTPSSGPRQESIELATKNTTRLGGADPAIDAAAVALAVYPGLTPSTRPQAVVLVDEADWPAAICASELAGAPLGAPILYARANALPAATAQALRAMHPTGAAALGGAQVIAIATAAHLPAGYRVMRVAAPKAAAAAAATVLSLAAKAQGGRPGRVIVLAEGAQHALQMPAAGLAAESGAPILFVGDTAVPAATAAALARLSHPTLYLLGAPALGAGALSALARFGRVAKIPTGEGSAAQPEGSEAVSNAIAVARFSEGSFGWGIREAGHGLAFASSARPFDAPAAAALSSHGDYAPLLLLESRVSLASPLASYLSDIQPGYTPAVGPVREVYNHGWLIGDQSAISARVQAEIDALLEVAPRSTATPGAAPE